MKGMIGVDGLYEQLISYTEKDYYPMHMPGHKRNSGMLLPVDPYRIDITEIEGFDNLHQPEGVIRQLSERLARLYGAVKSFPLINGSTAGILAGISASARSGDKILINRNAHKSVYHAAMLRGLRPIYLYPQPAAGLPICGGITAEQIEGAFTENQEIRLVVITSPTYEGIVSDIYKIAKTVHRHGAVLLVDEAHGAHFGFHPAFPESAVRLGADLVIQSLHKTLPAFTQTAVLHSNKRIPDHKIQQYLAVYQSSSPSYLLMAGMDRCLRMLEEQGQSLFDEYYRRLQVFYREMGELKYLKLADGNFVRESGVFAFDPSKLTISVQGTSMTGHQLQSVLRSQYHIEMEMAASEYVLGMTSICDTEEGFCRLSKALLEIDSGLTKAVSVREGDRPKAEIKDQRKDYFFRPMQVLSLHEVADRDTEQIKLAESSGRISAAFISLFPPGSPLIIPGEQIGQKLVDYIFFMKQEGLTVTGLTGDGMDEIEVVKTINIDGKERKNDGQNIYRHGKKCNGQGYNL